MIEILKTVAPTVIVFGLFYFLSRRLDYSWRWKEAMLNKMKEGYSKEEALELIVSHVHQAKEWYFLLGVGAGAILAYAYLRHWFSN